MNKKNRYIIIRKISKFFATFFGIGDVSSPDDSSPDDSSRTIRQMDDSSPDVSSPDDSSPGRFVPGRFVKWTIRPRTIRLRDKSISVTEILYDSFFIKNDTLLWYESSLCFKKRHNIRPTIWKLVKIKVKALLYKSSLERTTQQSAYDVKDC